MLAAKDVAEAVVNIAVDDSNNDDDDDDEIYYKHSFKTVIQFGNTFGIFGYFQKVVFVLKDLEAFLRGLATSATPRVEISHSRKLSYFAKKLHISKTFLKVVLIEKNEAICHLTVRMH